MTNDEIIGQIMDDIEHVVDLVNEQSAELTRLRARDKRLTEAMEVFGDDLSWNIDNKHLGPVVAVARWSHGGIFPTEFARKALSGEHLS